MLIFAPKCYSRKIYSRKISKNSPTQLDEKVAEMNRRISKYLLIYLHISLIYCIIAAEENVKKRLNMNADNFQSSPLSPFQIEMLELISRVKSESEMNDIRRLLGQYFAKQAEDVVLTQSAE